MKSLFMKVLCLLLLFIAFGSVSFGVNPDYSKMSIFNYNGDLEEFGNALCEIGLNCTFDGFIDIVNSSSLSSSSKTTAINRVTDIKNKIVLPSTYYFYFEIYQTSGNGWTQSNFAVYFGTSATSMIKYVLHIRSNNSLGVDYDPTAVRSIPSTNSSYSCWYWNLNNFYEKTTNSIDSPSSKIKFNVRNFEGTIQVNYNGGSLTAYKVTINNSSYELGNLSNLDTLPMNYQIRAVLGYPIDNTGSLYNWADYIARYYPYNDTNYSKNGLYITNTGRVGINTSYLLTNQSYVLRFDIVDINGNSTNLTNDLFDDSTNFTEFYTIAYGSNNSSGDLLSPDLDTTSGGNLQLINLINQLNQNESGNTNYIIGNYIIPQNSGDTFFNIPYIDYDNVNLGAFVLNFVNNLWVVANSNANTTINWGWLGTHSSTEFTTPDNAFFDVISILVNGVIVIELIRFFYKYFIALSTFDIDKILYDNEDIYLF